jgi:tetratricopeptide (TPR) repeat protein
MLGNKQILLIYLLLALAALIAFWQVNQCDFINFDDPIYVTDNIHVMSAITIGSIRWAFTTGHAPYWHPVTWMSHMLDVQLFGLNPRWHHLTSLLFHIANTLLLFFVFHRMTKAPWKSAFVAALFALHPLHVESVAWVAERKDVLSTFFWLLTMGAYIHYVEHRTEDGRQRTEDRGQRAERSGLVSSVFRFPSSVFRYLAVLIFFALGLMAKPMLVTLPFVLLLLDYWPLQRLDQKKSAQQTLTEARKQGEGTPASAGVTSFRRKSGGERTPLSANKRKGKSGKMRTGQGIAQASLLVTPEVLNPGPQFSALRPLLREKIPLFALAALSCVVTYVVQQKVGAVASIEAFSPGVRIANALVSYIVYIAKTIWPINLAVLYPHPESLPLWQPLGAVLLLIAVTISVIRTAKRFPYLAMGWLWFAGTLVPVIGIVQAGSQAMADRFTYMPLIGLFVMAAWGIPELLKKWQPARFPTPRKETLFTLSSLVLLPLFIVTRTQVGYWRNNIALYDHCLKVAGPSDIILCNRGVAHDELGNHRQAISDFDRAIEINPERAEAYIYRGIAFGKLGNDRQAISDFDRAIEIDPENADAHDNRGATYAKLGNHRQAISDYDRAVEIDPEFALAYIDRGASYRELGNHRQAISDFDRAIEINPKYADAYINRGAAYDILGNHSQAISDYDRAVEINPEYAEAYYNRGVAYGELGNHRQAISDFDRAIEINPKYADAYSNRGATYGILGNHRQAISDYDRAVEINPEHARAFYNRGLTYGRLGDHRQAISDYSRAIEINPDYAKAYYNRALAYGELGNSRQAIEDLKTAARFNNEDAKNSLRSKGISW